MSGLFKEFCHVIGIPNASKLLSNLGPLTFLNQVYIPTFYKSVPYNNLDSFNPDSRSKFYKNWKNYYTGEGDLFAEKTSDFIEMFMRKQGGTCFHRCQFTSMVLQDGGLKDSCIGNSFIRTKPIIPHSILFCKNLTGENSLHMTDLGNRVAPLFHMVDLNFETKSELAQSQISYSKIIKTDPEKDPKLLPYQHVSKKKREPDSPFKYYCDFDLKTFDPITEDGSELHVCMTSMNAPTFTSAAWEFQAILSTILHLIGINPGGFYVEYANNAYRRYDQNGQLTVQKFFPNKESMVLEILRDFPQFEEAFISQSIDCAFEQRSEVSMWPKFS